VYAFNMAEPATIPDALPEACITCGASKDLEWHPFRAIFTPWWAYLGALLGPAPLVVLIMLARKEHSSVQLFCKRCGRRYAISNRIFPWTLLAIAVVLLGGIVATVLLRTPWPLITCMAASALGAVASGLVVLRLRPRCSVLTRHSVVLNIPGVGEVPLVEPEEFLPPESWPDTSLAPGFGACPRCGYYNPAGAPACEGCGAALQLR
jgi:hypothetical protein